MSAVRRRRTRCAIALAMATSFVHHAAHAERPPEEEARLDDMSSLLGRYQTESSRYRTWSGVASTALGATSLTAGGFVLDRELALPGFVLVARGGWLLAAGVLDLAVYKTPLEELRAHFEQRRASAMSASEAIDATESEWVAKARSVRSARIRSGVTSLTFGGLLVAAGTIAAIADLGIPSEELSTADRASFASILSGLGGATMSAGLRSLTVEDPIESGWRTYARPPLSSVPRLQVIPSRKGMYIALLATF